MIFNIICTKLKGWGYIWPSTVNMVYFIIFVINFLIICFFCFHLRSACPFVCNLCPSLLCSDSFVGSLSTHLILNEKTVQNSHNSKQNIFITGNLWWTESVDILGYQYMKHQCFSIKSSSTVFCIHSVYGITTDENFNVSFYWEINQNPVCFKFTYNWHCWIL